MALMANDPADYIDQMILLTRRLTDLAIEQARLFEDKRFMDAAPINDEASRLAATYALETNRIAKNDSILNAAPQHLKEILKTETAKFRDAMARHERAITNGIAIAEGLVRAIAQEAVAARPIAAGYGPNSNIPQRRDTSAIALDRTA